MKIEIINSEGKKKIKFTGKINMNSEVELSDSDAKKLSEALISGEDGSFDTG